MTAPVPQSLYRKPSKDRIAQGDIGFAEVVQVRSASGSERKGPGLEGLADADLPYLGPFIDHELPVSKPGGGEERRILRVWSTLAIVLTQNCELAWGNSEDSRVSIAAIVTQEQWPEGPWRHFRQAPPPGYLYLPPLEQEAATTFGLSQPWPEAVALLASHCTSTARIVKPRRLLSLGGEGVLSLQDAVARFYGTRGFADLPALQATVGKPVQAVEETGQVVNGPSQLIKVFFGGSDDPEADDEISVAYWGVRAKAPAREPAREAS